MSSLYKTDSQLYSNAKDFYIWVKLLEQFSTNKRKRENNIHEVFLRWECKIACSGFVLERNHRCCCVRVNCVYDIFELRRVQRTFHQWLNVKPSPRGLTSLQFTSPCECWNVLGNIVCRITVTFSLRFLLF